ncbi:MAG TPA: class I SAM-dependent methyltransferase [Candidatus Bathyarchaeia archaeon]
MDWVALVFYLFVGFLFLFQVVFRVARRWLKFPTPAFLTQVIDNPIRRRFIQSPDTIADRMELEPGMTVVEVGPGKGSYTFAVARRVAPGTVYACDIQPGVVERLRERAAREGVANVDARFEDAYGFSFGEGTVDRVLMIACLPEIPEPVRVLRECRRILRPGGLVCLSELLPDPDYPLRSTERRWAAEAGLEFDAEYGNFFVYQLHFRKPPQA